MNWVFLYSYQKKYKKVKDNMGMVFKIKLRYNRYRR